MASVYTETFRHVAQHPQHARMFWRWVRDRHASPLDLRQPWWPYSVAPWLSGHLPVSAQVFEFGSGGSTLWLADQGYRVSSVEGDRAWYDMLRPRVSSAVDLRYVPPDGEGSITSEVEAGFFDTYVDSVDGCAGGSLDLVVVDGRCRVECANRSIPKLKAGGWLLLDDSDRPRYRALFDLLSRWERRTWLAPRPGRMPPGPSTVWRKPQAPRDATTGSATEADVDQ